MSKNLKDRMAYQNKSLGGQWTRTSMTRTLSQTLLNKIYILTIQHCKKPKITSWWLLKMFNNLTF